MTGYASIRDRLHSDPRRDAHLDAPQWPVRRMAPRAGTLARIRVRAHTAGRGPRHPAKVHAGTVVHAGAVGEGRGAAGPLRRAYARRHGRALRGRDRQAGAIIAEGHNQVTSTNDPTAHAEITAIRHAGRVLGTFDLSGYELYASCEPCPMCLAAIYWARLDRVYFANTRVDAARIGFDDAWIYAEIPRPPRPAACRWPVRLEFPILSLNPGLRQRCVAPDVWPTLGVVA